MSNCVVYALANQKGGVGKTTTAVNMGACLAQWGQRVLVVDVDPQANATSSLGINKHAVPFSTYDVLINEAPLTQVVQSTGQERLNLIPSAPALSGATVELVNLPQREHRLRNALTELRASAPDPDGILTTDAPYDYVLIDCPPSLGLLTINALTAADSVIIPVQCEYLALEGLSQLLHAIDLVRRALNPTLRLRGLVMTMYDSRTSLSQQVVEEVRRYFPGRVFDAIIPRNVRLSEAPSYGEPITSYAPNSPGAAAYATLARELLTGDGRLQPIDIGSL